MMKLLLLLAVCQDPEQPATAAPPTDKEAETVVKALKKAFEGTGEQGRISAIREASQVCHERVIKAIGDALVADAETVRIGAALALGEMDHPVSVDVLVAALGPNQKTPSVLAAIAQSLGRLGWERGAAPLNEMVRRVGDADVRPLIPDVLNALGQIGSASSFDPIIDILRKFEGPRRDPWPNEGEMRRAALGALAAITGGSEKRSVDWQQFWKANKDRLVAGAKTTYWVSKTHERVTAGARKKKPDGAVAVGTRLVDPPEPKSEGAKREKKGKGP